VKVRFHPAARRELSPAKFWFADRDPNSPQQFQDELDAAIAMLSDFPLAGQAHLAETRRMVLRSVPYALIYRIESSEVRIIAVAHTKRRPGYWRGR
jgi:plasmid stabilization system protein ParE